MIIAIVGFGSVGKRLAALFAAAGHQILVGSRKSVESASDHGFRVLSIFDAIKQSELSLLAIPYTSVSSLSTEIAEAAVGKIIIDCTNPLKENWSPLSLGSENSAAEEISRLFPKSRIVKCFNTIFADIMTSEKLKSLLPRKVTAFIAGNDSEDKAVVAKLASEAGFDALDVGDLTCARYLEQVAHLNIAIAVGKQRGTNAAIIYVNPN